MTGTGADVQLGALLMVGAAWLLVAIWAVIRSARIGAQAKVAQAWGLRLRGLLATAPGAYLIVGDEGKVTASDTLRSWLSIDSRVTRLSELTPAGSAGLDGRSFTELERAVAATAVSGAPFSLSVEAAGGDRLMRAEGRNAPPEVAGSRGVVVWFNDLTETAERLREVEAARREENARAAAARAMIDNAPIPIWRRSADLELDEVNGAYAEAVEAESPEAAVKAGAELLAGAVTLDPRTAARQALETKSPVVRDETAIIGGERRRLRVAEVPLPAGEVAGFAIDVTEVEEARADRDRLIQSQTDMFTRLSAGVARFAPDHTLASANQAFLRIFKFDEAAIAEAPEFDRVLEQMREARRLPEQRDFPSWKAHRRNWFLSAEPVEETWVLPDNEVLRVLAQPAPDGGLLLVFEDQSERLRLASSRDQLIRVQDATLQNLQEAVAVFGGAGRLQFYNRAFRALWNVPREMLETNPTVDDLFQAARTRARNVDTAELMRALIKASTEGRTERSGRLELEEERYIRFAAVPLPDGNALFTFDDVTDTEQVEIALRDRNEALEAADEAKSRFVENMSYELRTPLTAITGFGEMLNAGLAGEMSEMQIDYVGSILTSAERLRVMINGIIDLAVSDVEGLALDAEETNVSDLITDVAGTLEGMAADKQLTITCGADDTTGIIACDPGRLKQALFNLLHNAIRFTPEGGTVSMWASGHKDAVTICVRDDGIGIPAGEEEAVFERFYKGSNAQRSSGVGLGLSLVREVATSHGGRVDLISPSKGGVEVRLQLPRRLQQRERQVLPLLAAGE